MMTIYYITIPITSSIKVIVKYFYTDNPMIIETQNYIYKVLETESLAHYPFNHLFNISNLMLNQQSTMKNLIKEQNKTIALLNINSNIEDIKFISKNIIKNNFTTYQEMKD